MIDAYRVVPSGYVSCNSKDSFTRKVSGEALDAGCTPAIRVVSRLRAHERTDAIHRGGLPSLLRHAVPWRFHSYQYYGALAPAANNTQ